MDIFEVIFLAALLGCAFITINKLYNIYGYFTTDQIQSLFTCLLLYAAYALLWFFEYLVLLENPQRIIYMMLYNLSSWVLLLNLVLTVIELFCCMGWAAQKVYQEPYYANKERQIERR